MTACETYENRYLKTNVLKTTYTQPPLELQVLCLRKPRIFPGFCFTKNKQEVWCRQQPLLVK